MVGKLQQGVTDQEGIVLFIVLYIVLYILRVVDI
jgi:hypothetical protein